MQLHATASRAATLLAKRPGLFCRVMLGKLNTTRRLPPLPAWKRIDDVVFEYDLAHYRATAPMYFGSYAPLVVETMKRFLKPGGVFIDVGANIGYLSAIAANLVGKRGEVHAFEPVPAYCSRLRRLAELNPLHTIVTNEMAAGEGPGRCTIYITREPGQNTIVRGYQTASEVISTLEVPVVRLDEYIAANGIHRISLIKIDAEGFELPVLRGLARYFAAGGNLPPIICEIAPRAYSLQGLSLRDLSDFMTAHGYSARDMIDTGVRIELEAIRHVEDVLFVNEEAA